MYEQLDRLLEELMVAAASTPVRAGMTICRSGWDWAS